MKKVAARYGRGQQIHLVHQSEETRNSWMGTTTCKNRANRITVVSEDLDAITCKTCRANLTKTDTPVYDRARENVIGYASRTDTSVGAAKKVGAKRCAFAKINGVWAWHVTVCGKTCCRLGPNLETVWG